MSTLIGNEKVLNQIVDALESYEKDKLKGDLKRGELKLICGNLAARFGFSFYTIRTVYYKLVKGKYDSASSTEVDTNNKDKEVSNEPNENAVYKYGDEVTVKIKNILDYGAFVETMDGNYREGLIHISEIKQGYVHDISLYFEYGDVVDAKVKRSLPNGKIEFTTKHQRILLKNKSVDDSTNYIQDSEIIDEVVYDSTSNEVKKSTNKENSIIKTNDSDLKSVVDESRKISNEIQGDIENNLLKALEDDFEMSNVNKTYDAKYDGKGDEDLNEIIAFLNGIVGALSPEAKKLLKDIVNNYGVFKFTIAMMDTAKDFDNDIGLRFLQEVKDKANDGL